MEKMNRSQRGELDNHSDVEVQQALASEKFRFMKRWGLLPVTKIEFEESSLHEVEVQFKNMTKNEIPAFIKKEFRTYYELLDVEDNYVRFLYFLDSSVLDPAMMDVILYDIFGDYELGMYRCYEIK